MIRQHHRDSVWRGVLNRAILPASVAAVDLQKPTPQSPEWWLKRLLTRLEQRARRLRKYDEYYQGQQRLAFASPKFQEAFGDRFPAFSSNFMALVVDGTQERLEVQGFRFRDANGDKDLWQIWQDNDLDASSAIAHREALIKGVAYTLVEPRDTGPLITVEDPLDCILESAPRDRRLRRAGLKRWLDDSDGHLVVFLYLPDFIYKFRSTNPWWQAARAPGLWAGEEPWPGELHFDKLRITDEDWPLPNALGVVPLTALPNRPRLRREPEGQSEIAPVMSNQDAINKYRADALVAAEFAAFRQRWVIGLDVPVDPDTGKPVEPFKAAVDRLWTVPPPDPEDPHPPQVQFGEFAATDLNPYRLMIETEVAHVSAISRMPYHYLLGQPQSVPPSGESLKSAEAPLVSKVMAIQIPFGDGWEQTMRLALRAMRDERADLRTAETIWRDPETRNEATRVDSAVKLFQTGILDREGAQEYVGMSPEQRRRANERAVAAAVPPEPPPAPMPRRQTITMPNGQAITVDN